MGPLSIVEVDPLADDPVRLEAVGQLVQIDRLVFERPPQTFDEDVVHVPAPSVHRYRDLRVLENTGGWCQTNDKGSLIDASAQPFKQPVAATQPGRRSGFVCRYRD